MTDWDDPRWDGPLTQEQWHAVAFMFEQPAETEAVAA
jgi:hypothetical protein